MQLRPDWSHVWTSEKFEEELGIKFNGPGLYCLYILTLVVIPLPPNGPAYEKVWHIKQEEGTLFDVNCYNSNFRETIFGYICSAPSRDIINLKKENLK